VAGEQRVALIDQIEHGPDDERDEKGAPRHTIGDRTMASFAAIEPRICSGADDELGAPSPG